MRLVAIGLVSGAFGALFGVGGGIVVVPLLILALKVPARVATATSLAAIGITALAGTITYAVHGQLHPEWAALVGLPAAAGAVVGTTLAQRLTTRALTLAFAALLTVLGVWFLVG